MNKPLKDILNSWELAEIPSGIAVRGYTADGSLITTREVVNIATPLDGRPGWVETENLFYALGSPKA